MQIEAFVLDGLGHQSYLIRDEKRGQAAVVDPRRDGEVYLEAASRSGASVTHILETHVHNDYVTGARELAARTGATIVASSEAHLAYPHQPVRDGETFRVGELHFEVMSTPGHTPEHVSYVLFEPDQSTPHAVFSGGSMLAGGAGRTDLLGPGMTLTLTRQQYHSLRKMLATLPGHVTVYPTHGAGSFCQANLGSARRTTTIREELLASPAVQADSEEAFVKQQLAGYTAYPRYYAHMHDINQRGPAILGALADPAPLAPHAVQQQLAASIPLIDGRKRDDFARAHVPGSLNIELDSSFGTYAGWILPFNTPLMLLIEDEEGRREAVVQLLRIGYEQTRGYLDGGIAGWQAAALPTSSFERIDLDTLHQRWQARGPLTIIDVRRDDEWARGHIPGSLHFHIGDLPQDLASVPTDGPLALICQSGYRSEIAASILAASGREVSAVQGGVGDWLARGWPSSAGAPPATQDALHIHP
ncbi:MAG TPA: MBL fold metallo-hydrolase [Ktedonobacteraceae bacterium]